MWEQGHRIPPALETKMQTALTVSVLCVYETPQSDNLSFLCFHRLHIVSSTLLSFSPPAPNLAFLPAPLTALRLEDELQILLLHICTVRSSPKKLHLSKYREIRYIKRRWKFLNNWGLGLQWVYVCNMRLWETGIHRERKEAWKTVWSASPQ